MEKNVYIEALRFGSTQLERGVTFLQMLEHLEKKGIKLTGSFKEYFRVWFFKNFFQRAVPMLFESLNTTQLTHLYNDLGFGMHDVIYAVLNSQGFDTLQDYEKLQQAKQDAKRAHSLAMYALIISIAVGVFQIVLQVVSMFMDNNHFCLWCAF